MIILEQEKIYQSDKLHIRKRKETEYMKVKVNHKIIKEMCGTVSFKRGESFYRAHKVTINEYSSNFYDAFVKGAEDFHVIVEIDTAGKIHTSCSCPTLSNFQKSCQHVAAVLLTIHDQQHQGNATILDGQESQNGGLTENFLMLFNETSKRASGHQLHFEKERYFMSSLVVKRLI